MVTGFGAEATLTSDLVPINVDAVLFWMVWDAEKAALKVRKLLQFSQSCRPDGAARPIGRASASEVAVRRNQLDEEKLRKSLKTRRVNGVSPFFPLRFGIS